MRFVYLPSFIDAQPPRNRQSEWFTVNELNYFFDKWKLWPSASDFWNNESYKKFQGQTFGRIAWKSKLVFCYWLELTSELRYFAWSADQPIAFAEKIDENFRLAKCNTQTITCQLICIPYYVPSFSSGLKHWSIISIKIHGNWQCSRPKVGKKTRPCPF